MRRKEREITDFNRMLEILDASEYITLSMIDGDRPYSVPVNFGYKADREKKQVQIFIHGATEGTKLDCIKKCPAVSVTAVSAAEIGQHETPCGWTEFYRSVCASGNAFVTDSASEKKEGLVCILRKYGYKGPAVFPPAMMSRVSVVRIDIDRITGKAHEK